MLGSILTPIVEIGVISIILYYLLGVLWNTRAMDLLAGCLALLALYGVSSVFHWPVLRHLLLLFFNVAVLAVLILFQPELRVALSRVSLRSRRSKMESNLDRFIEDLTQAVYHMAEVHNGALIAVEQQDSLEEYAQSGVELHALFSSELIETIFESKTPLHDGAVIVRGLQITAAGAILPLAADGAQSARWMGTRHRAALGLSQATDAIVIVVSEESGKVSLARGGLLTRAVKADRFKGVLRSLFLPQKARILDRLGWKEWLSRPGTVR